MADTVTKKIYFYKLILEKDGKPVNPIDIFSHIKSLNLEKGERIYQIKKGKFHLMMFHDEDKDVFLPLKFILGSGKQDDIPCLIKNGKTEPLKIEDKSLFESTHMMLFNNNILGVEYNYQGPRAQGLKPYILRMARKYVDYVEVIQLTKPDFLETLHNLGDIKLFDLYVHRNFGKLFEDAAPSLYHTLQLLKKNEDAEEIGVHIKSSKRLKGYDWNRIFNVFKKEDVSSINKAEIKAVNLKSNKVEPFNLLDQYIISTKEVVKHNPKYKRVDPKSMFYALKSSFKENQSQIEGITIKKKQVQKTLRKWKE